MIAALVMVCAPVVGLCVPSCCRSPWPPRRVGAIGPLLRTALVGTPCQSVALLPRPRNKKMLATCSPDLKTHKFSRRVKSIGLFTARRRSVSFLSLRRRIQPPAGAVRLCRSLTCGGACLRARTSRLSTAALPLLPKKRHAES